MMNNLRKQIFCIVLFPRDLRNNEIMSLPKNSLDTFTSLEKLYVDEIVNMYLLFKPIFFVQLWICIVQYFLKQRTIF